MGNGLEIVTYLMPATFLITAALANALKAMAMLTSSATRNAIYKSFGDNIGDITAKGTRVRIYACMRMWMCLNTCGMDLGVASTLQQLQPTSGTLSVIYHSDMYVYV
jgi:succinate dehydrogenase/fumarate reductase-like Fe-S protein